MLGVASGSLLDAQRAADPSLDHVHDSNCHHDSVVTHADGNGQAGISDGNGLLPEVQEFLKNNMYWVLYDVRCEDED